METTVPLILTVNGGSSSLKVALYRYTDALECIGEHELAAAPDASTRDAMSHVHAWLERHGPPGAVCAIAHRLVHGGETFPGSCVITADVLPALRTLVPLAPNHLPAELALLDAFRQMLPAAVHIACFDTAFHHDLPMVARTLPVAGHREARLRRFGFHGLSYMYLLSELDRLGDAAATSGRVILAHLGSGASLAAISNGACVDTTMGLTPAGGLVMSTRSGDLDPGVITALMRRRHLTTEAVDELLTTQSGLLAVSGVSGDMKTLLETENRDPAVRLAVDVFCYSATKWIGALTAALHGLDTLVFSAGIGTRSAAVRQRICDPLSFLGLRLDPVANGAGRPIISAGDSRVTVRVIPTHEALVMARETRRLLGASPDFTRTRL